MNRIKEEIDNRNALLKDENAEPNKRPVLKIDWRVYEEYLSDADMSEDQKRELIETLWKIIISFVDLGFGIESTQQARMKRQDRPDREARATKGLRHELSS